MDDADRHDVSVETHAGSQKTGVCERPDLWCAERELAEKRRARPTSWWFDETIGVRVVERAKILDPFTVDFHKADDVGLETLDELAHNLRIPAVERHVQTENIECARTLVTGSGRDPEKEHRACDHSTQDEPQNGVLPSAYDDEAEGREEGHNSKLRSKVARQLERPVDIREQRENHDGGARHENAGKQSEDDASQ